MKLPTYTKYKYFLVFLLSYLIPKRKGYYLFVPTHDLKHFTGNTRAFITYLKKNHPELDLKVFSLRRTTREDARAAGFHILDQHVLWNFLRAQYFILDTFDVPVKRGNFNLIQLWHGSGFKEVGLRNETRKRSEDTITKRIYKNCKLFAATSDSDMIKQNLSYEINTAAVTGYPRNDVFFNHPELADQIKKKYKLASFRRIISYVPTFRDQQTTPAFSTEMWERLNAFLTEQNEVLVIKKHPYEEFLKTPVGLKNIVDLSDSIDTQDLLLITDLLISDYSSVMTDFAITSRPILVYAYDFEDYLEKCRGIYYNLSDILPKPIIKTENELFDKIRDDQWQKDPEYAESYTHFKNTFHQYLDGNSSRRIKELIDQL